MVAKGNKYLAKWWFSAKKWGLLSGELEEIDKRTSLQNFSASTFNSQESKLTNDFDDADDNMDEDNEGDEDQDVFFLDTADTKVYETPNSETDDNEELTSLQEDLDLTAILPLNRTFNISSMYSKLEAKQPFNLPRDMDEIINGYQSDKQTDYATTRPASKAL